ncbi:MAG: hypothetical protein QNJ37_21940 [Crocosphaera sp.]|nr:hypothetical protein [Crocosphaera sp.]
MNPQQKEELSQLIHEAISQQQIGTLTELFSQIQEIIKSEGISNANTAQALLNVAHQEGLSDRLLSQLEQVALTLR